MSSSSSNSSASPPASSSPRPDGEEELFLFESISEVKEKYAEQIAAVRAELSLPCDDDVTVYRFLRGHKLNVAVAADQLNRTLQWRAEHKMDELRRRAAGVDQRSFPFADKVLAVHPHNISHGSDKRGQPLSIERLGHANPYLLARTVKFDEYLQYHFWHMENKAALVAQLSAERGQVLRTCKIMDLSGLGRSHLDRRGLALFKRVIDMSQGHYPEMLGSLYVVNPPWIFSVGWKIVRPWLNAQTLAKIHILPDAASASQRLKADIDEANLPDWLGGTCNCGGRGCVPLVDPDAGMTSVQVAARGKYVHEVRVDAAAIARLRAAANAPQGDVSVAYEFRTKKNDISLEICATPLDQPNATPTLVKPAKRYASDQEAVCGSVPLGQPTLLTLHFDNSFSYFTGKTLLLRVDVEGPPSPAEAAEEEEAIADPDVARELQLMESPTPTDQ